MSTDDRTPEPADRPSKWVVPDATPRRPPPPRSLLVAGILLIALGLLLVPIGVAMMLTAVATQVDPAVAARVDPRLADPLETLGTLALFGGALQVIAGIGVLGVRRWARALGVAMALPSAVGFGLGAVVIATGAVDPGVTGTSSLDSVTLIVLLLGIAGAFLVAAIALTNDWPAPASGR